MKALKAKYDPEGKFGYFGGIVTAKTREVDEL